jgi:hypothetical protein
VSCPTRYQAESSSINLRRSIKYGLGVLRTSGQYRLRKHGLRQYPYLDIDPASAGGRLQTAVPAAGTPGGPAVGTAAEPAAAQVGESARSDG